MNIKLKKYSIKKNIKKKTVRRKRLRTRKTRKTKQKGGDDRYIIELNNNVTKSRKKSFIGSLFKGPLISFIAVRGLYNSGLTYNATDDYMVAAGSTDGTIQLWRVASDGSISYNLNNIEAHNSSINSIVFSPDGHYLISGSTYGNVVQWKIEEDNQLTGEKIIVTEHKSKHSPGESKVRGLAVVTHFPYFDPSMESSSQQDISYASSDANYDLYIGSLSTLHTKTDKIIKINPSTDAMKNMVTSIYYIVRFDLSPNGQIIAYVTKTREGTKELYYSIRNDNNNNNKILLHKAPRNIILACSNKYIVYSSDILEKKINIFNYETKKHEKPIEVHSTIINSIAFSPDGQYLVAGYSNGITVWKLNGDIFKKMLEKNVTQVEKNVTQVAFNPDGHTVVFVIDNSSIKLWLWFNQLKPPAYPNELPPVYSRPLTVPYTSVHSTSVPYRTVPSTTVPSTTVPSTSEV